MGAAALCAPILTRKNKIYAKKKKKKKKKMDSIKHITSCTILHKSFMEDSTKENQKIAIAFIKKCKYKMSVSKQLIDN